MNLLKQLRFGGVFGGVAQFSISTTTESKELVVRPRGFEPLTFCSGVWRSRAILLIPGVVWIGLHRLFVSLRRLLHNIMNNDCLSQELFENVT
jgi:hypothetical protein